MMIPTLKQNQNTIVEFIIRVAVEGISSEHNELPIKAQNKEQPHKQGEILYTAAEVAEILKVSRWTVYELVQRKKINSVKVGKRVLISAQDIKDFIH
jgi:excisionase family DNA binding protein